MDGFIISHSIEPVEVLDDLSVKRFVGEYKPHLALLDLDNPITMGALALPNYYMEAKRQQVEAMKHAPAAILAAGKAFEKEFGRKYGFFETYRMEDAELAVVVLGSAAGTSKAAVNELREEGKKVGLLKLRAFRPFPKDELLEALSGMKAIAVLDRCDSFGARGGPVYHEVRSALYDLDVRPPAVGYIYGLGGRDLDVDEMKRVYANLERIAGGAPVEETEYLTVRE
jgi:pyruvate ferredoxin oxidoreductase alpha subunit